MCITNLIKVFEKYDPFRYIYRFIIENAEIVCKPSTPYVKCRMGRSGQRQYILFDLMKMLPSKIDRIEIIMIGKDYANHIIAAFKDVVNPLKR